MTLTILLAAACCVAAAAASDRAAAGVAAFPGAEPWPLEQVRLLDGPFRRAQDRNLKYLLALEPDRLMGHLRENAGLRAKARSYGGWDSAGNQCLGHYLTALAHMSASTGDPEVRRRVAYIVSELAECQRAGGDGGLYAYAADKAHFARIAAGEVPYIHVSPWYVVHKLMAGLRDAFLLCGESRARDVLIGLADWALRVTSRLTPEQWQAMLDREHGGPHEVLADVYALTGETRYLDLARKFVHASFVDPLKRGDASRLTGLHANTQFPKVIGYERMAALTGDAGLHAAAETFWRDVTSNRTWANGGNSQHEHFFAPADFPRALLEPPGPETCNTYNMLRLTRALFWSRPSGTLMDFYERGLLNHVLASQDPETGGFVYHTSMRPGHYRTYSEPEGCFWCCVNTGMESHAKHGEMVYARCADGLYVNLFVASEARWPERGLALRQVTRFPDEPRTALQFTLERPTRLSVRLRRPAWAAGAGWRVRVNGRTARAAGSVHGYVVLHRTWHTGDRVDIDLPMALSAEPLPNGPQYVALFAGPVLLAGDLGSEGLTPSDFIAADGDQLPRKALPVEDFPAIVDPAADVTTRVEPAAGDPLTYRAVGLLRPTDVTFVPLYRLHRKRYAVYWPVHSEGDYAADQQRRVRDRLEAASAEGRTVDRVLVGDEASERAHAMQGERTETGPAPWPYTRWRHAQGWFEYTFGASGATELRCVYWGGDGGRTFDVCIDGVVVAVERLTAERPGAYITRTYALPPGRATVTVRLRASDGSLAGGLFDARTLRP